jgi:hypothetical protein
VPLSVAARVVPDLAIRPSFSHLGEVAIGSEIQRTYSLESRTGRRFVVERIDCQSPDVEIEELSSPDDNRIKPMRLTVRPSIAGDSAAEIRFIVRAEGTADRVLGEISQSVVLRLRYQGTARK